MPPGTWRWDADPVRPSLLGSASCLLPQAGMRVSGQGRYRDGDCGDRSPPRPENSWGCGRLLRNQGLLTRQEPGGPDGSQTLSLTRPAASPGRAALRSSGTRFLPAPPPSLLASFLPGRHDCSSGGSKCGLGSREARGRRGQREARTGLPAPICPPQGRDPQY